MRGRFFTFGSLLYAQLLYNIVVASPVSQAPTHFPTNSPIPTPMPTRPTSVPTSSPTLSSAPTDTPVPTLLPTLSSAPTVTRSVAPTDLPTAEPTTATKNPTFYPTLSPTKVETMIFQRLAIGASFLAVIIAYIFHSNTKQSALASRGLDGSLYKVREFRIEKRWGCQFCGYAKNVASSSICMQCGTNQLGEQEILPTSTAKGTATEAWSIKIRLDSTHGDVEESGVQNVDGSITRRLVTWEREDWPFELATEVSVAAATSEVPSALAISKQGFVVTENASTHGSVELQWMSAQSPGVPVPGHITSEFLADVQAMRKCFFPEKVAWLYEQLHRRQAEAMMEVVPMEFATAYPHSVLRDSLGLLTKISPLQVLMSRYKIQFVAARSHTRANAVAGDIEESWLKALFAEFRNPENGVLMPCDDGSLDLASYQDLIGAVSADMMVSSSRTGGVGAAAANNGTNKEALSFFSALGSAIAMAIVSRTFVKLNISPVICKLIIGRPVHFMDLLNANHALLRDLLKLTTLPGDAVAGLKLSMPPTTMGANKGPNAPLDAWPGRNARTGDAVTVDNRLEFVYRKMENELFTRIEPQFAAMRKALFDVIPQEFFSVFDHREFIMLLNGHHASDADAPAEKVWL